MMRPTHILYGVKLASGAAWGARLRESLKALRADDGNRPKDIQWPTNTNRTDPDEPLKDILPTSVWTGRTVAGTGDGPELGDSAPTGRVNP
jgi:hypothetical protein